jgi:hypothetical protein
MPDKYTNPHNPWQRFVAWMARHVPPLRNPAFPTAIGALLIVLSWKVVPELFNAAVGNAWLGGLLQREHGLKYLIAGEWLIILSGTTIAAMFWARVLQLSFPDYYDAFEDKHK